jgi:mannose-1-phosphate guanylyltransferase
MKIYPVILSGGAGKRLWPLSRAALPKQLLPLVADKPCCRKLLIGINHRLENSGTVPLHIIKVQSGGYLSEDDILRFDDVYQQT